MYNQTSRLYICQLYYYTLTKNKGLFGYFCINMTTPRIIFFCLAFLGFLTGNAQLNVITKKLAATRIATAPKIDGNLTDAVWSKVAEAKDFTVSYPNMGEASTFKTIVKIAYDNNAFYVYAYLYDNPKLIRKQLSQRDRENRIDVDFFSVAFDAYNDNTNAFLFLTTVAGVQSDVRISSNSADGNANTSQDYSWDAVWESKTKIVADGWCAEMKIPLSALRFSKKQTQTWGVQFTRQIRRKNETCTWNPLDRILSGEVNQYGDLTDIKNIEVPLRLSFLPYLTTGASSFYNGNNKFSKKTIINGGMDIKYGINQSFTLDATLIPDFGQVQSDNQVLNLSPFEVRFNDFRPFFQEGTELFNKAGLFYSRRIGDVPQDYSSVQRLANDTITVLSNPTITQLYNATKFSGFTKNNIGIGVFNAVSAPMYAVTINKNNNQQTKIETNPLTNYNIIVIDKLFKNRSYITFTNTNVLRNGQGRDANVAALDLRKVNKQNSYEWVGFGRYSSINGTSKYSGFNTGTSFAKIKGNITFKTDLNIESDKYDPNDLGFLSAPNEVSNSNVFTYRVLKPGKNFINKSVGFSNENTYLYKPFKFLDRSFRVNLFYLFKNFWDNNTIFFIKPQFQLDAFESRVAGLYVRRPAFAFISNRGSSDSRKKVFIRWDFGFAESKIPNDAFYYADLGLRYRFGPKFQVELNHRNETDEGNFGFSTFRNGKPIIAFRNIRTVSNIVSANYSFNALQNISVRLRHYWRQTTNYTFFDIKEEGILAKIDFIPNLNRNFNAFNIDAFYTYNFKPGSQFIINWQNSLSSNTFIDPYLFTRYNKNFSNAITIPHNNVVTLKFIYFLDYLQLKKKKG